MKGGGVDNKSHGKRSGQKNDQRFQRNVLLPGSLCGQCHVYINRLFDEVA